MYVWSLQHVWMYTFARLVHGSMFESLMRVRMYVCLRPLSVYVFMSEVKRHACMYVCLRPVSVYLCMFETLMRVCMYASSPQVCIYVCMYVCLIFFHKKCRV